MQTNFLFYCLAGSKFRAACLEAFFDFYQCFQHRFGRGSFRQRRDSVGLRISSNSVLETRNGLGHRYRHKRPSTPNQQTYTYQLSQSCKRSGSDPIPSSQLNGRRPSSALMGVDEV